MSFYAFLGNSGFSISLSVENFARLSTAILLHVGARTNLWQLAFLSVFCCNLFLQQNQNVTRVKLLPWKGD